MYTGEKVRLREYRKEDIALKVSFVNDPEVIHGLVADTPFPLTLHEEEEWFESISGTQDTYKFAIEALENGRYIGGCSINDVDWKNSVATIGIFIGDKNYRGKGYGADAMGVLLKFIFLQMNINKVRLIVYSFNKNAIKMYEKMGFKVEGILRQEMYRDGAYHDKIAMGILREEFLNK
jgi:RimJ/RimL family protein N-acetyltransferase